MIERSSERSAQQALQAQTIKKDGYDKYIQRKEGKESSKREIGVSLMKKVKI